MTSHQLGRIFLLSALLATATIPLKAASPATAPVTAPLQLDWKTLLPEKERNRSAPPPPPAAHDYLSEGDMVALQSGSFEPNRELDDRVVKIPGYVVPLQRAADGQLGEFLLVPYFGACIHLPPPPPNQVVYVKMRPGKSRKSIDEAIWVTGRLRVALRKSDMGSAVYTLEGEVIDSYR
jgi:hypothetical protein